MFEPNSIDPKFLKGEFGLFSREWCVEEVKLDGNYGIKLIKDEYTYNKDLDWHINCQSVYHIGKILYREDTENIMDLINMFKEYTYKNLDYVTKCTSEPKRLMGGTICPTRKELFTYNSKFFVAYGRYIFGYRENFVDIKPLTKSSENKSDDDKCLDNCDSDDGEYWKKKSKLMDDRVILSCPSDENFEYNFSFMIYDVNTKILDAFGLYM